MTKIFTSFEERRRIANQEVYNVLMGSFVEAPLKLSSGPTSLLNRFLTQGKASCDDQLNKRYRLKEFML